MKSIILYITLLAALHTNQLYGQAQTCLQNGDFQNACGDVVYVTGCPTWTNSCGDGWVRSHGTPQMIYYYKGAKLGYGFYGFMWSALNGSTVIGEGMFTPYDFQAHHSYNITIIFSTSGSNGSVNLYAANGLTQHSLTACGDVAPDITQKQLIGQYTGYTNGTTTVYFNNFTPTTNYTQLWIYPAATSGPQYNLAVLYVFVCPSCDGTIIYNNGVAPSGETKAGTIYAGSSAGSGGSGTVTVQSTQTTTFLATNEIRLVPSFQATVTTGTFDAKAINCGQRPEMPDLDSVEIVFPDPNSGDSAEIQSKAKQDLNKKQETAPNEIQIYPTVTRGVINISGEANDIENSRIIVYDLTGRKVFQSSKNSTGNKITIDLGYLKNGLYLLQIVGATQKIITKKIIINN